MRQTIPFLLLCQIVDVNLVPLICSDRFVENSLRVSCCAATTDRLTKRSHRCHSLLNMPGGYDMKCDISLKTCNIIALTLLVMPSCLPRRYGDKQRGTKVTQFESSDIVSGKPLPENLVKKMFSLRHGKNITFKVIPRLPDRKSAKWEELILDEKVNSTNWQIVFDELSEPQFETLKSAYGGRSEVKYSPGNSYEIQDFLPPIFQALNGLRYRGLDVVSEGTLRAYLQGRESLMKSEPSENFNELMIRGGSNCWGFAYEVARDDKVAYETFLVNGFNLHNVFEEERNARKIFSRTYRDLAKMTREQRNQDLKPGDILFVNQNVTFDNSEQKGPLLHAAVYVDDDLYFEKTGVSNGFLYRFVTFDQISATYGRVNDFQPFDNSFFTFFRVWGEQKPPLPKIGELVGKEPASDMKTLPLDEIEKEKLIRHWLETGFGGPSEGGYSLVSRHGLQFDANTGRASFLPSAFFTPAADKLKLLPSGKLQILKDTFLKTIAIEAKDLQDHEKCFFRKGIELPAQWAWIPEKPEEGAGHALFQFDLMSKEFRSFGDCTLFRGVFPLADVKLISE